MVFYSTSYFTNAIIITFLKSSNHPAQRPLPPIPQVVPLPAAKPHPPGQYEHYSRLEEFRGRRRRLPNGDVMDGTISGPEQLPTRDLYHRQSKMCILLLLLLLPLLLLLLLLLTITTNANISTLLCLGGRSPGGIR